MSHKKPSMIQSERGSVFSVFSEEEIKEISLGKGRKVAVSGKIHNPGIIDVPEGATLEDIINLCGGIINKSSFNTTFFMSTKITFSLNYCFYILNNI